MNYKRCALRHATGENALLLTKQKPSQSNCLFCVCHVLSASLRLARVLAPIGGITKSVDSGTAITEGCFDEIAMIVKEVLW